MEEAFFKSVFFIFIGLAMLALLTKVTIVIGVGLRLVSTCLAPYVRAAKVRLHDA